MAKIDFAVLESVPDATIIVDDSDGHIVYANEGAEQVFGYSRLELMGQAIEVLVPPRLREAHRIEREGYSTAPRRRPMGLGLDLHGRRSDGREFPAEISLSPLRVGTKTYIVAAVRDVTDRKLLEDRARLAGDEIRRRDELLATAAHELRGPLGTIQLLVAVLERGANTSSEELRSVIERMGGLQRQALFLTRLVNELLDLSQVHLGRLQLKLEEMDLSHLAREVVATIRDEAERAGSSMVVRAEEPATGRWDRTRLQQVITNLLGNAVKYAGSAPIEVRVDAGPATARVEIEDHGPGISLEDQARVFELFGRAAGVGVTVTAGLGIGLYISRQIVEAHGGRILLRSVPGAGSTFTVDLPRGIASSS
jgi:PAS domain S-box-containing protein